LASKVLELQTPVQAAVDISPAEPFHSTVNAMAAVYKTLSSGSSHDKPAEGRKNKQRVLILVSLSQSVF
jgi:hypothetical protein